MRNFEIHFEHPLLLLLIILFVAFTLIPYFRLNKRYRKTRNRITSMTLHIIISVLSIATLAGMTMTYDIPNDKNELILLVDVSETEQLEEDTREDLIQTIIAQGSFDNYNIGIVSFGFDQVYAAPLTKDVDSIYEKYLTAELPDTSATNIAAALEFTKDLFKHPKTAKIVLITDAKETDEEAASAIRSVTALGIKLDTAYVGSTYEDNDVQIVDIELPNYHVLLNEECAINVTVQSKAKNEITLQLIEDGVPLQDADSSLTVEVNPGTSKHTLRHTFTSEGLHELGVTVVSSGDSVEKNNAYSSYMLIEVFNRILILEAYSGESELLEETLEIDDLYDVDVVNLITGDNLPKSVDDLRQYDQIILNNVANADLIKYNDVMGRGNTNQHLVEGFDLMLEEYVKVHGGGLFTVGGNEGGKDSGSDEAHAYKRSDMYNTTYQKMLPVNAINYTPPLGLMIIVDTSGSMLMTDDSGVRYVDWAMAGATATLNALTERDYVGLMTLASDYNVILPLTPRTQEAKILEAFNSVKEANGSTIFPGAIERAGQALRALTAVDRRHILLVTDGIPGDAPSAYEDFIRQYYEQDGITISVAIIGQSGYPLKTAGNTYKEEDLTDEEIQGDPFKKMLRAVCIGNGYLYCVPRTQSEQLVTLMREDLNVPEIKEVVPEEFAPLISNPLSPVVKGVATDEESQRNFMTVNLGGFYGTKPKPTADVILQGEYEVPIYAQWKYGNGMVGSFMCDLNGTWSLDFMSNENGYTLLTNAIQNLMPINSIRPSEINVTATEYNYINKYSVLTELKSGEKIEGTIVDTSEEGAVPISLNEATLMEEGVDYPVYVTSPLDASNSFSRLTVVVKGSGVYKLTFNKVDKDGNVLATYETYKAFSYSQEYDTYDDPENPVDYEEIMDSWAYRGNGIMVEDITDPAEIYDSFVTEIHKTFDPRFLFMIIAITLFLLDIAVRKFKFKWPHEIYRDYKAKKSNNK
ncbi:MAG: VWA domain-containing protein [Clostridia bacterium]|nr:VWA domain-containing protein [Clostridia bacterium]